MVRIGLIGQGFIDWAGGLDFLRLVAASLHAAGTPVELHLLLPLSGPRAAARHGARQVRALLARALGRPAALAHAPSRAHILESVTDTGGEVRVHFIDEGPRALLQAWRRLSLDVVLPTFEPLPSDTGLAWVGYLYDFQHHHLPQLFSPTDCERRDRQFARLLDTARVVIANARAAVRHISRATRNPSRPV